MAKAALEKGKVLTLEEYLQMPEVKGRYEIVEGVMRMTPAPSVKHQWLLYRLSRVVGGFVEQKGLGVVLFAPVDILISKEPLRTRQPDLLFLSKERGGEPDKIRGKQFFDEGPDLVVEVLSPSELREEVEEKLEDYRRVGVRECWVVSLEGETVEVLKLGREEVKRARLYGRGDVVRSEVLEGLEFRVEEIFG